MFNHALRPTLTNATYEHLGRQNEELLHRAQRAAPHARGPTLAAIALCLLLPPESTAEVQRGEEQYFERWVHARGGEMPGLGRRDQLFGRFTGEALEIENLRWIGLAVLVALASGAFVWLLNRERSSADAAPAPRPPVASPRPQTLCFAVAAFSGKVRDTGATPDTAGSLLTQSTFWWVGPRQGWDGVSRSAGLSPLEALPQTDDALLVVAYEAPHAPGALPSSRPEGATFLREASKGGELRVMGTFSVRDTSQLSAAGFRK